MKIILKQKSTGEKTTINVVKFKEFFTKKRMALAILSLPFLYLGIFSNLVYPITNMINEPTGGVVIWGLLSIVLMFPLCMAIGLNFIRLAIHNEGKK
jgi:hypothetical protein